jgi:hypothetical protein
LLIHRVVPIAHGGLSHLCDEGLCVTQQQDLHATVAMELILELLAEYSRSALSAICLVSQSNIGEIVDGRRR